MDGPGAFFRKYRGLFALSLAGALGTSTYAVVTARKVAADQRTRWWVLGFLTASQAVGMIIAYSRRNDPDS